MRNSAKSQVKTQSCSTTSDPQVSMRIRFAARDALFSPVDVRRRNHLPDGRFRSDFPVRLVESTKGSSAHRRESARAMSAPARNLIEPAPAKGRGTRRETSTEDSRPMGRAQRRGYGSDRWFLDQVGIS